jgi:hypothetical protein
MSHGPPKPPHYLRGSLGGLVTVHADLLVSCRLCRHVARLEVLDLLSRRRTQHTAILALEAQLRCQRCGRLGTAVIDLAPRE